LQYFRSLHWAWYGAAMPSSAPPHPYQHHRFPSQMLSHAVWLSLHGSCSHRNVEKLLCARGVIVSSRAICTWCHTGGASCTPPWRCRPRLGHTWHLDKVCITLTAVQEAPARPCSRAQTRGRAACRCSLPPVGPSGRGRVLRGRWQAARAPVASVGRPTGTGRGYVWPG
jgi:hypothetical protein